jgi:hypothetical protein
VKPAASAPQKVAAAQTRRTPPTISESPVDDRLDDAFGDEGSFSETMTGIAATIGKSLGGARNKTTVSADKAGQAAAPTGRASSLLSPKLMAGGAAAVVVIVALAWMFSGSESPEVPVNANKPGIDKTTSTAMPRVVESAPPSQSPSAGVQQNASKYAGLLDEARIARDAGEIVAPAGSNAIELYLAARDAAPNDVIIASELAELINQALGMAESALLAQKTADADAAIKMVRLA